jgi:hypothetical protein
VESLEHTLEQLREYDTRSARDRRRAVESALDRTDFASLGDRDDQRRAAARLVVEALAVLAGVGGLASDVRSLMGERGHVHDWPNLYRSCTCGRRSPTDRRSVRPRTDGIDYCSEHDLDGHCPYFHAFHAAPAPDRYPAGPDGDRLAWLDTEYATDD